ncbi:uncharacterized protein LOC134763692 [Penaeus indicus]|uniref:uncharacterized protein LOC134763692 n=1 Tax=Penaeus indicus TaxID=29960 RepID=UPI00300C5085
MKEFDDQYSQLKRRVDQLQEFSRRKIRIEGVEETAEMTQEKVQRLLRDTLEIGEVQLERTHRTGSPIRRGGQSRPRTTIVRVSHFADQEQPLHLNEATEDRANDKAEESTTSRKTAIFLRHATSDAGSKRGLSSSLRTRATARLRTRILPLPWADAWAAAWAVAWAGAAEATAVTSTLATTSRMTRETRPPTTTTATTLPAARTSPAGTRAAASSLGAGRKVRKGLSTRAGTIGGRNGGQR